MKKIFLPLLAFVLIVAGCGMRNNGGQSQQGQSSTANNTSATNTTITYFVSANPDQRNIFCNGGDMDSAGYQKSLTKKVTQTVAGALSLEDKIKTTLSMAANDPQDFGPGNPYTQVDKTTFVNGVVTLRPASGWAGSSIFMCAWQPFAEKQLEQFPEVKQVKWEFQS